ncbi:MAG: hypothetical protein IJT49_04335 [Clostridia bacterium]|nr:hypothetical protein [Clostridia bacterium]
MKKNFDYEQTEKWLSEKISASEQHLKYGGGALGSIDKKTARVGFFQYPAVRIAGAFLALVLIGGSMFGALKFLEYKGVHISASQSAAGKYIYSFDFDINGKVPNTAAEISEGETAYTVSDKDGNRYETVYSGDELIYERITDKDGRILYTAEIERYPVTVCVYNGDEPIYERTDEDGRILYTIDIERYPGTSEDIDCTFTSTKTYIYKNGYLIKEASCCFCECDDARIAPASLSMIRESEISKDKIYENLSSRDISASKFDSLIPLFELPIDEYLKIPYLQKYYDHVWGYRPFNGNSFSQYELDYEYKNGIRYVSGITYSTDFASGTGKLGYDGGVCTIEFSSDGRFVDISGFPGAGNTEAPEIINDIFKPSYSSSEIKRGYKPAKTDKEKSEKSYTAEFYYTVSDGVCAVAELPFSQTFYDSGAVSQICRYNADGTITESEHYSPGELTAFFTYEYENGLPKKRSFYKDIEKTEKNADYIYTYDTARPDVISKEEIIYYKDGKITGTKRTDYNYTSDSGSARIETKYDGNGVLTEKNKIYINRDGSLSKKEFTQYENGSVKRILTEDYGLSDSNSPLVREYDGSGTLVNKSWYDADGTHHDYSLYESGCRYTVYDGKGNLLLEEEVEKIPD